MKITKRQLRRIIREVMDYDPMGDEGVPHVGVRPEYALAFIDSSYGDRRMELAVDKRDAELARVVMKKLRKQGFNVFNLRGGVLAWALEGRPFVTSTGEDTRRVHVYSGEWDVLLPGYESVL